MAAFKICRLVSIVKRLLLRVTGRAYTADAVFAKQDEPGATWRVESTAPMLAWMHGYDLDGIKARLSELHATYEWLPCDDNHDAGLALWRRGIDGALKADAKRAAMAKRRKERTWNAE